MSKTIIFDTEATGIKEPVLIEAAWVELESIEPFTVTNPFEQRYKPGKPITLGALATHHSWMRNWLIAHQQPALPSLDTWTTSLGITWTLTGKLLVNLKSNEFVR